MSKLVLNVRSLLSEKKLAFIRREDSYFRDAFLGKFYAPVMKTCFKLKKSAKEDIVAQKNFEKELKNKERTNNHQMSNLAYKIKNYKITLDKPFSIDRCISTSGGISFNSINEDFMLVNRPNTYVAGEMLDWEAPTGGYLLQACISNGAFVANNIINKKRQNK